MSIEIRGIDVSEYQGAIDWAKVKAAGYDFAFVRLGWCGYDGRIVANGGLDKTFRANMAGAIAAGVDVGVYVFSYATTAAASKIAAQETLSLVADYKLTYPVVFDIEDSAQVSYTANSKATNTTIVKAFLDVVSEAGYVAMVYANKAFADSKLDWNTLAGYDFWLAQWASRPTYTGDFTVWQYSATGRVDGIAGDVDLNIAYRDYAALYDEDNDDDEDDDNNPDEGNSGEDNDSDGTGEGNTDENTHGGSTDGPLLRLIRWLLTLLSKLFGRS